MHTFLCAMFLSSWYSLVLKECWLIPATTKSSDANFAESRHITSECHREYAVAGEDTKEAGAPKDDEEPSESKLNFSSLLRYQYHHCQR